MLTLDLDMAKGMRMYMNNNIWEALSCPIYI